VTRPGGRLLLHGLVSALTSKPICSSPTGVWLLQRTVQLLQAAPATFLQLLPNQGQPDHALRHAGWPSRRQWLAGGNAGQQEAAKAALGGGVSLAVLQVRLGLLSMELRQPQAGRSSKV
jgi:hypothetical protein